MNIPKKLFLLDGMALVYRAHFALSKTPRFTSTGLNTSAVMGFANTLMEIIGKEKPTHIAVIFDTDAATARHTDFKAYKAQRQEMPEDLSIAIPYVKKLIEGFRIPVITCDGFEADDVIGTLAKKAEQSGFTVFCMTPDKDFAQLVSNNIFIYKPAYMGAPSQILGVNEVLSKWEIERIDQVTDILGLWGDAVDNIPGIPGVGEKTAKLLIKQFGTMENVLDQTASLKGRLKENLESFREQGLLSKKLATILLDAPVELDEAALILKTPDDQLLKPLLDELEFKNLGRRIFGPESSNTAPDVPKGYGSGARNSFVTQGDLFTPDLFSHTNADLPPDGVPEPIEPGLETDSDARFPGGSSTEYTAETPAKLAFNTITDIPHTYTLCDTEQKISSLLEALGQASEISFDTETTSTDANAAELVGMSFAIKPGEAWYVPVPAERERALDLLERFRSVLENEATLKIGQNLKYDMIVLSWYGIALGGKMFDTMLAHYIIDPDTRHNMDFLATSYLNYSPIEITELIGKKGKNQGTMRDVPLDLISDYAAEDADVTLQLKTVFNPILERVGGKQLAENLENPLVAVLASMEKEGVRIDPETLKEFSAQLEAEIRVLESSICSQAGEVFNISSPKQLGEILFDKLKIDEKAKKTRTGQYQTGEDILSVMALKNPIVQEILDYRSLQKLKSTYVDALPLMINTRSGRVHTSFNQAVAATGRLSSNNPNLQNIPIRTQRGREVRKAFLPRDSDHVIISADYSQIELRIIAEISGDPGMMEAFLTGIDIHTATAARVYGVSNDEVDSAMRRNAKSVNFGIIYGQSAFGLSQNLGIPRKEAAEIIRQYFIQYPNIQRYMQNTISFARENGFVETIMKRRRYLRDINSANQTVRGFAERNAINAPIQGSAADLIKIAMIHIHNDLKQGYKTKMTMQVHDELVFDAPRSEVDAVSALIKKHMQEAIPLKVPIVVEVGSGENWLEAH